MFDQFDQAFFRRRVFFLEKCFTMGLPPIIYPREGKFGVENMLKMYCTMAQVIVGRKDKTELDDLSSRNGLRH